MKKTIALLMSLALIVSALALPALAEESSSQVDQTTSATVQTAKGGRGGNRQQMPGQNNQNGQAPQLPGQNGQMPQMPGQNDQYSQNGQMPVRPGKGGRNARQNNGTAVGGHFGKQLIFDQLLADGVITQEIYDAITAWMNQRMQQSPENAAAPADSAEPPAQPDNAQEQLLKELLDNGVITQEQYDTLSGTAQAAPAAPEAPETQPVT